MHAQTNQAPRRRLLKPLIVALAAASGGAAWAQDEPSPYFFGAKVLGGRDSNVFRIPGGLHDYYTSTSLLGGFDQKISRQRLYADAAVDYNKYHNNDSLDNTSYAVKAGWDWATIENLAGSFYGNANRNLATFNGNADVPVATRNLIKADQLGTTVRWGGEGLLTLEGAYAHSRVKYSAPEYFGNESSADTASIGGYYRAGASLRLGLAVRGTRTESPYAVPLVANPVVPSDYTDNVTKGKNLDLLADWRYSEQTAVFARLSYTEQTNSRSEAQNFSGITGALKATYAPTGKLAFDAEYVRDAGSNATFYNVAGAQATAQPILGLTTGSQTVDLATLGVRYAATAKISVNAGYRYRHAKILNTQVIGGTAVPANQVDNLHGGTLGVTYDIARAWQLGCNVARETRDVTGTPAFSYGATVTSCSVQFLLK